MEKDEVKKKAEEVENDLLKLRLAMVDMFEKIMKLKEATDYIQDEKHDND